MGALQSRSGADGAPPAEGPDGAEALDGAGAPAEALDGAVALVEGPADPKRRRDASGILERVFEKDDNLSRVLAFTGFTAVYTIEKLSSAAHKATRAAKFAIEVQLGKGDSWRAACICAAREELLMARRAGRFQDSPKMYSSHWHLGLQSATSDVVYDQGGVYVKSAAGSLTKNLLPQGCMDPIRSAAALAAEERHRRALLQVGIFQVDYSHCRGDTAGEYGRRELCRMIDGELRLERDKARKRDDAEAASLIDAMGGELGIPRRLADAARRRDLRPGFFLTASHLTSAIECAADASAVLDKLSMERLLVAYVWDTIDESISHPPLW